jgi:hypothetical protein
MYVKWVVRRHKNEELANISFYDAYLVQSYKNEAGEPRQRTLAYLGNLRQIDGTFPVIERALFYIRMEDILLRKVPAELITDEERVKLYNGLSTVAPPPTDAEIRLAESLNRNWHSSYWKIRANNPSDLAAGFAAVQLEEGTSASDEAPPDDSNVPQPETPLDKITIIGRLSSEKPGMRMQGH